MTPERPRGIISGRWGSPRRLARVVSCRMDDRLLAAIRVLAAGDGVSVSDWIRNAASAAVFRQKTPVSPPGYRIVGWKCEHLSVTAGNAVLYDVTGGCGCEMQPIYEPVLTAA